MRCQNELCQGAELQFFNAANGHWRCPHCGWTWTVFNQADWYWLGYRKFKGEDENDEREDATAIGDD